MMRAKRYVGSGRQDRKHGEEMVSKKVPTTQNSPSAAKRAAKAIKQPAGNDTRSSDEERWRRTAIAAYYRAEARGFAPGGEIEDWLAAERDVDLESPADASASASAARSAEDPKRLVKPSGKSARKRTTPTRGSAPDARKQGDRS